VILYLQPGSDGQEEYLFESVGDTWFSLPPAIVNLILSALLWISLKQAKDILCNEGE
jgi:hypothetical protein